LSKKRLSQPLDEFYLFYEEIIQTVPVRTRIRRVRQTSSIN